MLHRQRGSTCFSACCLARICSVKLRTNRQTSTAGAPLRELWNIETHAFFSNEPVKQ
jgi:hypothetical protein